MALYFYCYSQMSLVDVLAFIFATPLFVTVLSIPLLGEKVRGHRWAACIIGFLGVIVIIDPTQGDINTFAILALVATFFNSLSVIFVRQLGATNSAAAIVFTITMVTALVSTFFVTLIPGQWVYPLSGDLIYFIGIGLLGGIAQMCFAQGLKHGEASLVTPFEYSRIIWASALGFFIWGDIPGVNTWVGMVIITASGLYILYRETYLRRTKKALEASL